MVGHTGFLTTARLLRPEALGSRPGESGPTAAAAGSGGPGPADGPDADGADQRDDDDGGWDDSLPTTGDGALWAPEDSGGDRE
jgi:hypothetical protein